MTVGILQCGSPPGTLAERHGTYGEMMRRMLGPGWQTTTDDVPKGELPGGVTACGAYLLTDGLFPGRWDTLRPMTPQELKATSVLWMDIDEATAKVRAAPPGDPEDAGVPVWAGVLPLRTALAAAEIAAALSRTTLVAGDVGEPDDVRCVIGRALELGGGTLAGLVNNAGMSRLVAFLSAQASDWDQILDVNARSAFIFTRHALPGVVAGKGAVVNVSSVAGKIGEEGLALYCASKAALLGLTQALALELGVPVDAV